MERAEKIVPIDMDVWQAASERWDSIAKPLGSFGVLEEMICRIAAVQGSPDVDISRRCAVVMCGDHGVVAEGVTQCRSDVTAECAAAIASGRSNINAVASAYGIDVMAVDVGMSSDADAAGLVRRKAVHGTRNMVYGPAMTREETAAAIKTGIDIAGELKSQGVDIIITGEMGIGNTTASSAIASVLLGLPPREVTGRGAGLSSEGLERKIAAVERAIEVNHPSADDPVGVLSAVGGAEIAGMTGLFLGGAYYHIPVIADGVISAAAAAIAYGIAPLSGEYMLASHCSGEPAGEGLLRYIGLRPVIDAGLRLGEGTGGALLIPLLDGAIALYRNSHRFDDTNIERYTEQK